MWKERATPIKMWGPGIKYTVFIDENSPADSLDNIIEKMLNGEEVRKEDSIFTTTACIMTAKEHRQLKGKFNYLKTQYWNSMEWFNRKKLSPEIVCFHSREIRNKQQAFGELTSEQYESFMNHLTEVIEDIDFTIISVSIDLRHFITIYKDHTDGVYETAFKFILERLIYFLKSESNCNIILESRGKKEDNELLKNINRIIFDEGTEFISKDVLEKCISGVYFDPKFTPNRRATYAGLELADLCSYPIHKFVKYDTKDGPFNVIEKKLHKYPKYKNKGLKVLPSKFMKTTKK